MKRNLMNQGEDLQAKIVAFTYQNFKYNYKVKAITSQWFIFDQINA